MDFDKVLTISNVNITELIGALDSRQTVVYESSVVGPSSVLMFNNLNFNIYF